MQAHALLFALCFLLFTNYCRLLMFVHSRLILLTRWVVGGFVPGSFGQLILDVLCSIITRFGCVHPIPHPHSPSPSSPTRLFVYSIDDSNLFLPNKQKLKCRPWPPCFFFDR